MKSELKKELSKIFHEVDNCKESKCSVNKKDIDFIFKPDKGIKDKELSKKLLQPKLCDCVIQKDGLILLELKCRKITTSILEEIKEQLLNVANILKDKNIDFDRAIFIYDRLDNNKMKQRMPKILSKRLEYIQFKNKAITL